MHYNNRYPTRQELRELGDMTAQLLEIEQRWARDGVEAERRLELNDAIHKLKSLFIKSRKRWKSGQ